MSEIFWLIQIAVVGFFIWLFTRKNQSKAVPKFKEQHDPISQSERLKETKKKEAEKERLRKVKAKSNSRKKPKPEAVHLSSRASSSEAVNDSKTAKISEATTKTDVLWSEVSEEERWALMLLGLTPISDEKEILAAYRKKLMETHPDKFQNEDTGVRDMAESGTRDLNQAKDVLLNWLTKKSS